MKRLSKASSFELENNSDAAGGGQGGGVVGTNTGKDMPAAKGKKVPPFFSRWRKRVSRRRNRHALQAPRLVHRNLPFHQSKNYLHVKNRQTWSENNLAFVLRHDWFHVFLTVPTGISLPFLLLIWTVAIIVFACLYMAVDRIDPNKNCGLGAEGTPIKFISAFPFSLETCTTVGYGLPNSSNGIFEEGCGVLQFVIYLQMVWSMLFNAFLFAFFYTRLAKCDARGVQVLMSNKAIVSWVDDQVRLQIRLYDTDARRPVVEAHVRLYVVAKERPVPRPLRILQPDDDYGGMLFLSFPYVMSHHIDLYSMLHPSSGEAMLHPSYPACLAAAMGYNAASPSVPDVDDASPTVEPAGLFLRQVDSAVGMRDDVVCPVCGEDYGTMERWTRHVRYQQIVERNDNYPRHGSHLALKVPDKLDGDDAGSTRPQSGADERDAAFLKNLERYFKKEISEIICVVEGIDPLMSGTFQALQSYQYEDIVWDANAQYSPCLGLDGEHIVVDLDRFHEIGFYSPDDGANDHRDGEGQQGRREEEQQEVEANNGDGVSSHAGTSSSLGRNKLLRPHDSFMSHGDSSSGSSSYNLKDIDEGEDDNGDLIATTFTGENARCDERNGAALLSPQDRAA